MPGEEPAEVELPSDQRGERHVCRGDMTAAHRRHAGDRAVVQHLADFREPALEAVRLERVFSAVDHDRRSPLHFRFDSDVVLPDQQIEFFL